MNCLFGNMLGNVSNALPDPNSYKPIGSQISLALRADDLAIDCEGANADAPAARAAIHARESLAIVEIDRL
jgi:hypothetical protein